MYLVYRKFFEVDESDCFIATNETDLGELCLSLLDEEVYEGCMYMLHDELERYTIEDVFEELRYIGTGVLFDYDYMRLPVYAGC